APPDINPYRTLLPGHPYVPPPPFDGPLPSEADESGFDSPHGLRGIGRPLARLIEAHWAERPPRAWLADLRALYAEGHEGENPSFACQVTAKGHLTRFPFVFPEAEQVGGDELAAAREGVLRPLLAGARARLLRDLNARTDRAAKAMERRLDGLTKRLGDNAEAEMFRRKGQLLLANLAAVPPRAEKVTLTDWGGAALDIALDPRFSPSRNAERYFRKYKKARCDPERTREEIASLEGAIGELREQGSLLAAIEDPVKFEEAVRDVEDWLAGDRKDKREGDKGRKGGRRKGRSAALPPHLRFEVGGVVVLVGLSARGNRYVTFKQAAADDLWLHAHEVPGAHVVVHGTSARGANARGASGREGFDPEVLRFAASLAAAHSRAKDALSVQVDYTERRHVRAVPGTVALVTYTNPGTLRAAPRLWKEFEKEAQKGRIPDAQE
ncbi:MAG: NFACT family protein, partial [Synergistaceae bacterium]|nr:NFACT family protein [Synergistaceae bacterium]